MLRRFENGIPFETIEISTAARAEPEFPYSFSHSGSLTPGDWTVRLKIDGGAPPLTESPSVSTAEYAWDASLTITPEPNSLALLGVGLLIVNRRRMVCH